MTSSKTTCKAFDDLEGCEIAAQIASSFSDAGYGIRVTARSETMGGANSNLLDADTARALARWLTELADQADEMNG